jgi:RNA polymerase sigma factor (TIGR02999 family)
MRMSDVTRILNAIEGGDPKAADELLPLVYEELRLLAAQKLSNERPGQTLQATALVHEAYIRLVQDEDRGWDRRGHFFAAAAEAMRRILVENARRKKSSKHGGDRQRIDFDNGALAVSRSSCPRFEGGTPSTHFDDLLALDEALTKLSETDPGAAELVKLRYFAGLTIEQAARLQGISRRTAVDHWAYARAWLRRQIGPDRERSSK